MLLTLCGVAGVVPFRDVESDDDDVVLFGAMEILGGIGTTRGGSVAFTPVIYKCS